MTLTPYYNRFMETIKIKAQVFIGFAGSGKTTALFNSLGKRIISENDSCKSKVSPKDLYQVISCNKFNMGHNEICEKFCRVIDVPFVSSERDFSSINYEKSKTYFIDTGSPEPEQKSVCDFFSSEDFETEFFLTIPAFIDTKVLGPILQKYDFVKNPKIILTFCDLVSEEKITEITNFLAEKNLAVVARNKSARIPKGLEWIR